MDQTSIQSFNTPFPCPGKGTLIEYSFGTLARSDMESIARHVDSCAMCLYALQSLDDRTDDLLAHLRQQPWDGPATQMIDVDRMDTLVGSSVPRPPGSLQATTFGPSTGHLAAAPTSRIGPYQLMEPIGEGGMGRVYKALHVHLGKTVAVKILSAERVADPQSLARFTREMKAVGQVNHPHIVQAFDAGVDEVPYLAMELIDGSDLTRVVKARGPLSVAEACECTRQAALGLQHAHQLGLVHRDIKPSNLMLTPGGTVKILDLGLALLAPEMPVLSQPSPEIHAITRDDVYLGTLGFMAPEQYERSHAVDIRADLYSLGCTLCYLLTGRVTTATGPEVSESANPIAFLLGRAPNIQAVRPDVPQSLALIIDQLLAKDPEHRPATPEILAIALLPFVGGANLVGLVRTKDVPPLPVQLPPKSEPPQSPVLILWLLGIAVFVLALCLLVWFYQKGHPEIIPDPQELEEEAPSVIGGSVLANPFPTERNRLVQSDVVGDDGLPGVSCRQRQGKQCAMFSRTFRGDSQTDRGTDQSLGGRQTLLDVGVTQIRWSNRSESDARPGITGSTVESMLPQNLRRDLGV